MRMMKSLVALFLTASAWTVNASPAPGSTPPPAAIPGPGVALALDPTQTSFFRDPFQSNQVELDVLFAVPCGALSGQTGVQIQVVVPSTPNAQDTLQGDFTGGFGPIYFPGTSNNGAYISYDGLNTFTFFGFDYFNPVSGGYYEVVVDILDSTFATYAPQFLLNKLNPGQTTAPSITLTNPADFLPTTSDSSCAPAGGSGDPQFAGFQGQNFQFHGLPDEHFNLISSPQMQLNSHFVYLANGDCNYNDTMCWTHPGTYMDELGWSFGSTQVRVVAGPHAAGMSVFVNEQQLKKGHFSINTADGQVNLRTVGHSKLLIESKLFAFEVVNADFFFNFQVSLLSQEMLAAGSKKHTVTDRETCTQSNVRGVIDQVLLKKYHVTFPVHGLLGQTWRNVDVCGKQWLGTPQDYIVSNLFGSDYTYNFFNSTQ